MGVLEDLFHLIGELLYKLCKFLFDVAEFLFERILDALAIMALICSLVNPFSWESTFCINPDCREKCWQCLGYSFVSAISIAMLPVVYASPLRWHEANATWTEHNLLLREQRSAERFDAKELM